MAKSQRLLETIFLVSAGEDHGLLEISTLLEAECFVPHDLLDIQNDSLTVLDRSSQILNESKSWLWLVEDFEQKLISGKKIALFYWLPQKVSGEDFRSVSAIISVIQRISAARQEWQSYIKLVLVYSDS